MAKIRTIKPEFWQDERLARVSRDARLLFIGLLNLADDFGTLRGNPHLIRGQVFPFENIDLEPLLAELAGIGRIIRYRPDDEDLILIVNFTKHQKIDKRDSPRHPLPPGFEVVLVDAKDNKGRPIKAPRVVQMADADTPKAAPATGQAEPATKEAGPADNQAEPAPGREGKGTGIREPGTRGAAIAAAPATDAGPPDPAGDWLAFANETNPDFWRDVPEQGTFRGWYGKAIAACRERGLSDADLRESYRRWLRDPFVRELKPPGRWSVWAKQWGRHLPSNGPAPGGGRVRKLTVIPPAEDARGTA